MLSFRHVKQTSKNVADTTFKGRRKVGKGGLDKKEGVVFLRGRSWYPNAHYVIILSLLLQFVKKLILKKNHWSSTKTVSSGLTFYWIVTTGLELLSSRIYKGSCFQVLGSSVWNPTQKNVPNDNNSGPAQFMKFVQSSLERYQFNVSYNIIMSLLLTLNEYQVIMFNFDYFVVYLDDS